MNADLKQALRLWAAMVIAWALLLNAILPSGVGAAVAAPSGIPICSTMDGHAAPAGDKGDHGALCCVLCTVAGGVTAPAPEAVADDAADRDAAPIRLPVPPAEAAPRAPPESWPLNPRAPPVPV